MENDRDLFNKLLYEEANDSLIFRPQDYKFDGALILEKSEVLRDILSAANAWRRADTYILIGVEEVKGGKNRILGVIDHLNEKKILEFVNSKVQREIKFSYQALTYERKKVGMLHIPLQERPFYLKENFANLKKYVIYVRRGSSIIEADTDEVAKIKEYDLEEQKYSSTFILEFANYEKKNTLGNRIVLKTYLLRIPTLDSIPDYKNQDKVQTFTESFFYFKNRRINKNYYRELADHYQKIGCVSLINFCVTNKGPVVSENIQIEINVEDKEEQYFFFEEFELPPRPKKYIDDSYIKPIHVFYNSHVNVRKNPPFWNIQIKFPEIPPQKSIFSNSGIYIGAKSSSVLEIDASLSEKNLLQPLHFPLNIEIQTQKRKLEMDVLRKSI